MDVSLLSEKTDWSLSKYWIGSNPETESKLHKHLTAHAKWNQYHWESYMRTETNQKV